MEKKTNKRYFSSIDLAIIVLILIIIITFFFKSGYLKKIIASEKKNNYYITFVCDGLSEESNNTLSVSGLKLYLEDGSDFCQVLSYDSTEHENGENKIVHEANKLVYKLTVTATAELSEIEYGYLINGKTEISPGASITIIADNLKTQITVISIDKV